MQITIAFLRSKSNPCGARPVPAVQAAPGSGNFNPRASCGARPALFHTGIRSALFQSSRPLRGATSIGSVPATSAAAFQSSRPLRGATLGTSSVILSWLNFNPRAPCGARHVRHLTTPHSKHYNPRAPCGARPTAPQTMSLSRDFNPRAPCGARPADCGGGRAAGGISILAPLAGRDNGLNICAVKTSRFQSSRPLRGATVVSCSISSVQ